ncbi:Salivary glue protein Sgs-4 [Amphibalanus amphitrite]|uniref:Salivary glue protein Sgs-4 n=1 Tax=Amphibalanus amphitrite TaxID=1232801 RepID=A0A6A4WJ32_AMPAM|nr:Salivary glue protein Sgs-4 [Amphibalanus amphitrite]
MGGRGCGPVCRHQLYLGCRHRFHACRNLCPACRRRFPACRRRFPACRRRLPTCRRRFPACRLAFPACRRRLPACRRRLPACRRRFPACRLAFRAYRLAFPACRRRFPACRRRFPACRLGRTGTGYEPSHRHSSCRSRHPTSWKRTTGEEDFATSAEDKRNHEARGNDRVSRLARHRNLGNGRYPYGPRTSFYSHGGTAKVTMECQGKRVTLAAFVVPDRPLGVDMVLGMSGITALGGISLRTPTDVRICAAAAAAEVDPQGLALDAADFSARFEAQTGEWTVAWKWADGEGPEYLQNQLVSHLPVVGWLRPAAAWLKRRVNALTAGWDDPTEDVGLRGQVDHVVARLNDNDPTRGPWRLKGDKLVVWTDASSIAAGVVLEDPEGGVVEDASWLRPESKAAMHINMAELDAALSGVNMAIALGITIIDLCTDSATVHKWIDDALKGRSRLRTKAHGEMLIRRRIDVIRQLVEEFNLRLTVVLVKSADNLADALTRVPKEWLQTPDPEPAARPVAAAAIADPRPDVDPARIRAVHESTGHQGVRRTLWYFTSIPLVEELRDQKRLSSVGTLNRNKRLLPKEMTDPTGREAGSNKICFRNGVQLASHCPKPGKVVLVASTRHKMPKVDQISGKPEIVLFFNSTKGEWTTVCLTMDLWSSRTLVAFLDMTVNFVALEPETKLGAHLLAFKTEPEQPTVAGSDSASSAKGLAPSVWLKSPLQQPMLKTPLLMMPQSEYPVREALEDMSRRVEA